MKKIIQGVIIGLLVVGIVAWFNRINPYEIYLSLWETGKQIPLINSSMVVPSLKEIKEDEPVILRFALTQSNISSPQITTIYLTFPSDAKVEPDKSEWGWWERNNDDKNTYFISYSSTAPFVKGALYTLPALKVTFKKVGLINFDYRIIGNKMNPIDRKFTIDTRMSYEAYQKQMQNYWTNEVKPATLSQDTGRVTIFDNANSDRSVTPSTCIRTLPRDTISIPIENKAEQN